MPKGVARNGRVSCKNTPRAMVSPSTRDLEWAAGFLEGEGSFLRHHRGGHYVNASQVNPEPVNRLKALFGGNITPVRAKGRRAAYGMWQVCGTRARGVAMTLYDLLSVKRQGQIRTMLGAA